MRALAGVAAALFTAVASAQEVLAPPAGTEFVMRCGSTESRWVVEKNEGGRVRVHRAGEPSVFRDGPVWGYMLGDIYDEQGLGPKGGVNRMTLVRGAPEGLRVLAPDAKYRGTYKWASQRGEAERTHVITARGPRRVQTAAFGEQEVFEVTDEISGPLHDLRREVQYAPALRMFVSFKIRNNQSKFEQSCDLTQLKTP